MAKVGMPGFWLSDPATSSCVESGLDAQSVTSAPPAWRVVIRLAVSVVTCKQAPMRTPFRGFCLAKRALIEARTGISRLAHSIRLSPSLAKPIFLTSYFMGLFARLGEHVGFVEFLPQEGRF